MSNILTSNIIKLGLIKYGVSTLDAARILNLSVQTVRNQSNSKNPTLATIKKYADIFDIEASELIALSE